MKQGILIIVVITLLLVVSGCSGNNQLEAENDVISRQVKDGGNHNKESPYIRKLPLDKQHLFAQFKDENELSVLYSFTPEEMVLVYLHCLSIDDADLLYELTFNNNQLPDTDKFKLDYKQYAIHKDYEIALHANYYNAIEVDERTDNGDSVMVIISADAESSARSVAFMLQKEEQVWKIDFYPQMKKYIK